MKNSDNSVGVDPVNDKELLRAVYDKRYESYHFFTGLWFTTATFFFGGFSIVGSLADWASTKSPQLKEPLCLLLVAWPISTLALSLLSVPFSFLFVKKFIAVQRELGLPSRHITRGGFLLVLLAYAIILSIGALWLGIRFSSTIMNSMG